MVIHSIKCKILFPDNALISSRTLTTQSGSGAHIPVRIPRRTNQTPTAAQEQLLQNLAKGDSLSLRKNDFHFGYTVDLQISFSSNLTFLLLGVLSCVTR